ncbi:MAG: 5-formaminoimidazole-4-carboxamide-1-(beta)-D-ribofuranosyl 5'-monophosphate synthetase [Candidatus Altiarchaeales archaeon ex4484_2]|nr:MAG: 5-formaminoimidazole-4-carboxamide-1-(beta)-D-ribofuranosyl 5'-monophosphate synthetase [Candidatus Altiarchaeales archaeon ex4484_2]
MLDRRVVFDNLRRYDLGKVKVGVLASHSALDVADGAIEEGFRTKLYCQKGREKTYTDYFKSRRVNGKVVRGVVDEYRVYDRFKEIMEEKEQENMLGENILFVPNRSFTSYVDLTRIEDEFRIPMVGSRNLLRSEERGEEKDYYWLLEKADLPYPKRIDDPVDIDELVVVKMHHAKKKLERGFFTAASYEEYKEKSGKLLDQGVITDELLKNARIEEYIIGPVFNFDFFYSPIEQEMNPIELLGVDWRFETSLDGHVRLPATQQLTLNDKQKVPEYTVCGHNTATVRESLLEKGFQLAEKYVKATKEYYKPGIIGPFCLQTCVDKDNNFFIYDVAPRVGGGTNVHMSVGHPYSNTLWRTNVSTGRRLAMEIKRAIKEDRVEEIVT